jgi:3'-phosphoadenosine 5'-phosphosulfate sulfotransferase (PAPS reductase)/FAD synthetase
MTTTERDEWRRGGGMIRIVSVSGGKDSTAMYLWATEQWGKNGFVAVFADTGHEHPVTYNYLRNMPELCKGPQIVWVKNCFAERLIKKGRPATGNPMHDLCVWKGRVPSSKAQFCTEHLKLFPIKEWANKSFPDGFEMYVGIRAGESERRSKMPEKEFSKYYDCDLFRPLLKWTEQDVFEYLKKHGVEANPLYAAGYARVGCYPCIHARKLELARLEGWAWDRIETIEKAVGQSWFSAGTVPGIFIPTIDDVKHWCKTTRGGRMTDMFAPESIDVPTCMSTWGVCE